MHMDNLKPHILPREGKPIPCHYLKPTPKLPETHYYVVQKILDHKIDKRVHRWKVRWKGYCPEEDTWEPASSFVGHIQQDWKLWNKIHNIPITINEL